MRVHAGSLLAKLVMEFYAPRSARVDKTISAMKCSSSLPFLSIKQIEFACLVAKSSKSLHIGHRQHHRHLRGKPQSLCIVPKLYIVRLWAAKTVKRSVDVSPRILDRCWSQTRSRSMTAARVCCDAKAQQVDFLQAKQKGRKEGKTKRYEPVPLPLPSVRSPPSEQGTIVTGFTVADQFKSSFAVPTCD